MPLDPVSVGLAVVAAVCELYRTWSGRQVTDLEKEKLRLEIERMIRGAHGQIHDPISILAAVLPRLTSVLPGPDAEPGWVRVAPRAPGELSCSGRGWQKFVDGKSQGARGAGTCALRDRGTIRITRTDAAGQYRVAVGQFRNDHIVASGAIDQLHRLSLGCYQRASRRVRLHASVRASHAGHQMWFVWKDVEDERYWLRPSLRIEPATKRWRQVAEGGFVFELPAQVDLRFYIYQECTKPGWVDIRDLLLEDYIGPE